MTRTKSKEDIKEEEKRVSCETEKEIYSEEDADVCWQ